jgi:hypothetical protein
MTKIEDYLYESMGRVYWKKAKGSRGIVGNRFGSYDGKYWHGMFEGKMYREHQLVWYLNYGYIPKYIDHINNNPTDNRIENLREVTQKENGMNAKLRVDNTTGCKGVFYDKARNKYRVEIVVNKVKKCLGRFEDIELACLVANEARDKYHGEYARFA